LAELVGNRETATRGRKNFHIEEGTFRRRDLGGWSELTLSELTLPELALLELTLPELALLELTLSELTLLELTLSELTLSELTRGRENFRPTRL